MNCNTTENGDYHQSDSAPRLFEVFFDMHHPAASLQCQRARMVKPPEGHDDRLCAELCKPSFITNILYYAFPDFFMEQDGNKFESSARLNRFDVYIQAFSPHRHTFTLRCSNGQILYGHVLRYLSPNPDAIGRNDVGRRETRAMVLLTRAGGGERFFYTVLKSLEACMAQSAVDYRLSNSGNSVAEKAIHFLHTVYRAHLTKSAELMLRVQRGEFLNKFDDNFMIISGIEWTPSFAEIKRDRIVRGGWVTFRLPNSLQPGYKAGIAPDDIDSPIMPLIRCLSAENILSVLSALLCERKVIFISADATKLSACVHAASAMLAQGCLNWNHVFFPILPPHMLSCLSLKTPYLVGVMDLFVGSIQGVNGMMDVLRVDLDNGELRTYHMVNPAEKVPDITNGNKKQSKPSADAANVGDFLLSEIEEIQKTERRHWGGVAPTDDKGSEVRKEEGSGLWGMLGSSKKSLAVDSQADSYAIPFGPTRGWMGPDQKPAWRHPGKPVTQLDVCDNDRGEASIRGALMVFFLSLHGDLADLLVQDRASGKYELDRRRYLLSKKKRGALEDSSIFLFYRTYCNTALLSLHIQHRLAEIDGHYNVLLPHHQPLFMNCAKTLQSRRMAFTIDNIRKIVSKTLECSAIHLMADHHESVRSVALELTASPDNDGDVLKPLRSLISSSYECDGALGHIISVVWSRLDDPKTKPKQHLLTLHLLKILLQNGPITTLSIVADGFNKIRAMKRYSMAKSNENKEIQESALEVCELLTNHSLLFLRRKFTLSNYSQYDDILRRTGWGNYMIRRLPVTVGFQKFHELLTVSNQPKSVPGDAVEANHKVDEGEQHSERSRCSSIRSIPSQESASLSTTGTQQQQQHPVKMSQQLCPTTGADDPGHSHSLQQRPMIRSVPEGFGPGDIARALQRTRNASARAMTTRSNTIANVATSSSSSSSSNLSKATTDHGKQNVQLQGAGSNTSNGNVLPNNDQNIPSSSSSTSLARGSIASERIGPRVVVDRRAQQMRDLHRKSASDSHVVVFPLESSSSRSRSSSLKNGAINIPPRDSWSNNNKMRSTMSGDSAVDGRNQSSAGSSSRKDSLSEPHKRQHTILASSSEHKSSSSRVRSTAAAASRRRAGITSSSDDGSVRSLPIVQKVSDLDRQSRVISLGMNGKTTTTTLSQHQPQQRANRLYGPLPPITTSSIRTHHHHHDNNSTISGSREPSQQSQPQRLSLFLDSEVVIRSRQPSKHGGSRSGVPGNTNSYYNDAMEESVQDSLSTLGFTEPTVILLEQTASNHAIQQHHQQQ